MSKLRAFAFQFARIALPYFKSEDRWAGRGLLAAIVALQLFQVWLSVQFNAWNGIFYTSLQDKDWSTFIGQLLLGGLAHGDVLHMGFAALATLFILTAIYQLYLTQWLQIRWRGWLTGRYLDRWLDNGTHYRMHLRGDQADNPDQRIAEDVRLFINNTLNIGVGLLGSVVSLGSFVIILWNLSASFPLVIGGNDIAIPGYLVWGALLYAGVGTWVTHLVGRPLVRLNFEQQRFEADFRFALVRLRENSEEVTLLDGERAEKQRLNQRFGNVVGNWYQIMGRQKRLTLLTSGYGQLAMIFPFVVVSPLYFAGAMALGGLMQIASAFNRVQDSLSFFIDSYAQLATWKSVLDRLTGFEGCMDWARQLDDTKPRLEKGGRLEPAFELQSAAAPRLRVAFAAEANRDLVIEKLMVALPSGEEIVNVSDLAIAAGERVLVTGPSGSGKTSLFRALGGAWPFGAGRVVVPEGASTLVLPQRAYIPLGSLRGALAYPGSISDLPQGEAETVLEACGLGYLVARLEENGPWSSTLSGGEQQRLSIARALLQRPDWLFLDEATSALDEASEGRLYRLLRDRLPATTVVSIGHRQSLAAYHDRFLELKPEAPRRHRLAPVARQPRSSAPEAAIA